jgi:hypothetical protein
MIRATARLDVTYLATSQHIAPAVTIGARRIGMFSPAGALPSITVAVNAKNRKAVPTTVHNMRNAHAITPRAVLKALRRRLF